MIRIQTNGLHASYDKKVVLRRMSFEIRRGELVGIVGPNGAGKSTLLKVIGKILKPAGGEVRIDGCLLDEWRRDALARILAVVQQETPMDFPFTVRQVVGLGRIPFLKRFQNQGSEDRQIIERALERAGLSELGERPINEMSSGERQRVSIARALAQRPEILLLDEPTAHMDIRNQVEILDLLAELCRQDDLTILAVLHDLNLAAQYCRRLIMIRGGQVYADGSPQQVLDPMAVREVYGIDAVVLPHPVTGTPCVYPIGEEGRRRELSPLAAGESAP